MLQQYGRVAPRFLSGAPRVRSSNTSCKRLILCEASYKLYPMSNPIGEACSKKYCKIKNKKVEIPTIFEG